MPHEIPEDADPAECFAREMRIKNALEVALYRDDLLAIVRAYCNRDRPHAPGEVCPVCLVYHPGPDDVMTLS